MNVLEIDLPVLDVRPRRLLHIEPGAVRLEAPFEEPLGFLLLGRNDPDHLLAQTFSDGLRFDLGHKAPLVFFVDAIIYGVVGS